MVHISASFGYIFHYIVKPELKDPEIRRRLTPTYELGCKRITQSSTFLKVFTWKNYSKQQDVAVTRSSQPQTFNKPNVELVTEKIEGITPAGIRSGDGIDREVDVIIYATGGWQLTTKLVNSNLGWERSFPVSVASRPAIQLKADSIGSSTT